MLLALDMGNTDIVIALHNGSDWVHKWRNPTQEIHVLEDNLMTWIKQASLLVEEIEHSIFSSVVPQHNEALHVLLTRLLSKPPIHLGPEFYENFPINIQNPKEIGADLVANAFAAYLKFGQACVVVDFGTALSFTVISDEGEILGVSIAPGLRTAMKALFSKTAQLFEVPLTLPGSVIGKNTEHALQAGILGGYVGLVKELLRRIESELGKKPKIVATGGLVNVLTPLHEIFDEIDPNHTLEGLRAIAERFG